MEGNYSYQEVWLSRIDDDASERHYPEMLLILSIILSRTGFLLPFLRYVFCYKACWDALQFGALRIDCGLWIIQQNNTRTVNKLIVLYGNCALSKAAVKSMSWNYSVSCDFCFFFYRSETAFEKKQKNFNSVTVVVYLEKMSFLRILFTRKIRFIAVEVRAE